jgi:hypothetical protein
MSKLRLVPVDTVGRDKVAVVVVPNGNKRRVLPVAI